MAFTSSQSDVLNRNLLARSCARAKRFYAKFATKFDVFFAYNSITRILPSSLVHGSADRALVAKTFEGYRQITA